MVGVFFLDATAIRCIVNKSVRLSFMQRLPNKRMPSFIPPLSLEAYYAGLIGNGDTFAEQFDAPQWNVELVDNSDLRPIPDRFQWVRGDSTIMLNVDIALVRDFTDFIDDDGQVTCRFKNAGNNQVNCPHAAATFEVMADYRNNNTLFLHEFRDVMNLLLVHGYEGAVAGGCDEDICEITSLPTNTPTISAEPSTSAGPSFTPTASPKPSISAMPSPAQTPAPTLPIEIVVSQARSDIQTLIQSTFTSFLPSKFLRLAFHDCVGGCDGCVSTCCLGSFSAIACFAFLSLH